MVDRVYVRQEYRRAFPGEVGELTFSSRSTSSYVEHLVRAVDLTGVREAAVRVVVDAGHGSAGLVLPGLLGALGVDAYVVNSGLDESRPADTEEETDEALRRLGELVAGSGAAFGVRFDRVGERLRLVDDRGLVVDDDRALLLLVDLVSAEARGGSVALPVTATRVARSVAAFHGVSIRWTGVGSDAVARLPSTGEPLLLAGDGAGRFVIPSVAPTADALAAFARLVGLVARARLTMGEIDDRIPRSAVVRADVRTPWAAKGAVMREVAGVARQRGVATDLTEGIKIIDDGGAWCLVVPDPAEAVVRLWAEGDTPEDSQRLVAAWSEVVARATR